MSKNAVNQLACLRLREFRNILNVVTDHFSTDNYVTNQLALISVVVSRIRRELFYFSNVVTDSCSEKQVPVKERIMLREEIADTGNGKRML